MFGALRAGHAYIAMDSLAPARGFRFWAEGDGAALRWATRRRPAMDAARAAPRSGAHPAAA